MSLISRLRNVTGKRLKDAEARIREQDRVAAAEADAILDSELAENPELRAAKEKVRAMQRAQAAGKGAPPGAAEAEAPEDDETEGERPRRL